MNTFEESKNIHKEFYKNNYDKTIGNDLNPKNIKPEIKSLQAPKRKVIDIYTQHYFGDSYFNKNALNGPNKNHFYRGDNEKNRYEKSIKKIDAMMDPTRFHMSQIYNTDRRVSNYNSARQYTPEKIIHKTPNSQYNNMVLEGHEFLSPLSERNH